MNGNNRPYALSRIFLPEFGEGYYIATFPPGKFGGPLYSLFLRIEGILEEVTDAPAPVALYLPALIGAGLSARDSARIARLGDPKTSPDDVVEAARAFDRILARYV